MPRPTGPDAPGAPLPIALSIAGSDPTGGAGLQADLQVFRHLGVHGAGVVTALTVQDTARVHRVLPVFPTLVLEQLRTLIRDLPPRAVKVGMLGTDDVVRNALLGLAALPSDVPVVLDPVLRASDGSFLLERRAWPALQGLVARAELVTPNLEEARALTGCDTDTAAGVEAAGRALVEQQGAGAALVKGGHRAGAPDDCLVVRERHGVSVRWLPGERVDAGPVHGTGCALSAAVAARLALGDPLAEAVETARAAVRDALRAAARPGAGAALLVWS